MLASLRRACSRALGGAVLAALLMSACGGGDSADSSSSSSSVTVAGADGASVTFDEHNVAAKTGRTVRVARNASGAPQLPSNVLPVGGIYEFTPLGLIAPGVEIRVPFNADALPSGARPLLMVAAPGEPWMQVQAARREGSVMVARVPRLTHAVVVAAPEVRRKGLFKLALGGEGDDGYSSPLQVAVASSTPTLPTPDAQMMVPVTQPTSMTLRATYDLPPECTGSRNVALMILGVEVDASGQEVGQSMSVLADAVPVSSTGELSAPFEFGVGRRGVYQVLVTAACFGDGQMTYGGVSGFVFQVDTHGAQTTGPVISAQPQNRSVVEGETVSFSVEASGGNLAYQWQRSHDGGQTYGPVTGSGATSTFAASLADHGSLWRVLVSNESGTATSVPALLTVAQRVLPPTVTSDPSNQSVLEGETASFTVVGTGTPAPTIEWQVRGAAVTDPEAGWSVIAGASGSTYTSPATTLSQSGAQYRAVLRNAGGAATSLPATLTVQRQVIAPAIVSAPQSQSVQEGQFGAFTVSASGTTPLSYQWFRNGQAIIGATAPEVLVYADPNDVGTTYQVTVQVSNVAGTVTSAAALMTVTPIPGTPVSATTGGVVQGPVGSRIGIPAGALAQDVTVTLRSIPAAGVPAPAGFEALGDALDIQPASLTLGAGGVLSLPVPDTLPEGRELALLEFEPTSTSSGKLSQWLGSWGTTQAAARPALEKGSNIRRMALSAQAVSGVSANAISGTPRVRCLSPQAISGALANVTFLRGGTYQLGSVGMGACGGYVPLPPADGLPSTSQESCGSDALQYIAHPNNPGTEELTFSLKNRHVSCDQFLADTYVVAEDRTVSGSFKALGNARIKVLRSVFGKPTSFVRTYEFRFEVISWTPDPSNTENPNPTLSVGALISCNTDPSWATCVADADRSASLVARVGSQALLKTTVTYKWSVGGVPQGALPFAYYYANNTLIYSVSGSPYVDKFQQSMNLSVGMPRLRCDDGLAHGSYAGCVFDEGAAVLVLDRTDANMAEAAAHVWEAQNPSGSIRAPGRFLLRPGTRAVADSSVRGDEALYRALHEETQDANRTASCGKSSTSLINSRPYNASDSCRANPEGCTCDEYPFAASLNGGAFDPTRTSAKWINGRHNSDAGGEFGRFVGREHVLDLSPTPEQLVRGDEFWVHVK